MLTGLIWQVTGVLQCTGSTMRGSIFLFLNNIFYYFGFPYMYTLHIVHFYPVKVAGLRRLLVTKFKGSAFKMHTFHIVHVLTDKHIYQIHLPSKYKVYSFRQTPKVSYRFLSTSSKVNANSILYSLSIGIQINTQYIIPFKVAR